MPTLPAYFLSNRMPTLVPDRGPAGLPGHRVLVARVPGRVLDQRARVLVEVGHHAAVERGEPAELDQVAEWRAVVRHHDDVEPGGLLGLQRRPYLGVERHVVADRLGVVDLDAGRLGELLQRGMLALQHVDVIRPVGEVDRVVQLLLGPPRCGADTPGGRRPAAGRSALDTAGGQERAYAQCARAGSRGSQQLPAGQPRLGQPAQDRRVQTRLMFAWIITLLMFHS